MVYRVFVEKKKGLDNEARALLSELRDVLKIKGLTDVRIINRYDVENVDEKLFEYAKRTVFSEPQLDLVNAMDEIDPDGAKIFAVEYLPGQFDQRADSAAQCIQIISRKDRPVVKTARVYMLYGQISDGDVEKIKRHVINPVEARQARLEKPDTLKAYYEIPKTVETLTGFNELSHEGLKEFLNKYALAMDIDDIAFCQNYFKSEKEIPLSPKLG